MRTLFFPTGLVQINPDSSAADLFSNLVFVVGFWSDLFHYFDPPPPLQTHPLQSAFFTLYFSVGLIPVIPLLPPSLPPLAPLLARLRK